MNTRPVQPRTTRAVLLTLALTGAGSAQVPPGWCAISANKENGAATTGDGGIYLAHPRSPMALLEVAGLPGSLTAAGIPFPLPAPGALGANCILLHRNGDLLTAPIVQPNQPLDLLRLPILGSPATGFTAGLVTAIPLGVGAPAGGGGGIVQMAFVSDDVLLVAGRYVSGAGGGVGPMGSPGPLQIARVDLATAPATVTPLTIGTLPFPPLVPTHLTADLAGIAYAADSGTVSFGVRADTTGIPGLTGATSWVCSFQLAAPAPARVVLVAWMPGLLTNLATRPTLGGNETLASLTVGSGSSRPVLYSIPAGGAAMALLPTANIRSWDVVNALAVEPSTGELLLCGNPTSGFASTSTGGVHWLDSTTGAATQLANKLASSLARGPLTGIAVAPLLSRSGSSSSCTGGPAGYTWSDIPHPDKLPSRGNLNFFVDIDWPFGSTLAFALGGVGFAPLSPPGVPLPGCPNLTLLTAPVAWWILVPGRHATSSQLPLPLPAGLPPGLAGFTQSAFWTQGGLVATDLLRIDIL